MAKPASPAASIRIRIAYGTDIAIGQGKADLLEAIGETGSISAAARRLEMSYRKAWLLVDEMNQCFHAPVVAAAKGGHRGGGAVLTPTGEEALARFRVIQAKAAEAIAGDVRAFRKRLLD